MDSRCGKRSNSERSWRKAFCDWDLGMVNNWGRTGDSTREEIEWKCQHGDKRSITSNGYEIWKEFLETFPKLLCQEDARNVRRRNGAVLVHFKLGARARVRGRGCFVCGRAQEPRYKLHKPHEPRARVAPTDVDTSKGGSLVSQGRRHVQLSWLAMLHMEWTNEVTLQLISEYETHRILSSPSYTSNWAAMWTALACQQ
jgi:hypothetical protein